MPAIQIHEDNFLLILWNEQSRVIGIDWKESTSTMTDMDFMTELALFAGHVEEKNATGILVDITKFRHRMTPEIQQWRVKNVSSRYNAAGVRRFAFVAGPGSPIPHMNESNPGENFLTRVFVDCDAALDWLSAL